MSQKLRIIGIDPGLRNMGWGLVDCIGSNIVYVASGVASPPTSLDLASRLKYLSHSLSEAIKIYTPNCAAIEETFVNNNPTSTLKLGQARGAALLTLALCDLEVAEFSATEIKKCVTGNGRAEKSQVAHMVNVILGNTSEKKSDALDALAVAICGALRGV